VLTPADLRALAEGASRITAAGERYAPPQQQQQMIDR